MEKSFILEQLRKYVASKINDQNDKKTAKIIAGLQNVTENDISFGNVPEYFYGYLQCNSTGVGESTYQGTSTRRTVSKDYTTGVHLFIDGHDGAAQKGLELFHLQPGQKEYFYRRGDMERLAKEQGFQLHLQDFRDLNFSLQDHRLNRCTVNVTKGPFTYPIRPVFAAVIGVEQLITIGYVYEYEGKEYILIEPEDFSKVDKKERKSGCAPWMFLGFIFPPVFLVALIVILANDKRKEMRG